MARLTSHFKPTPRWSRRQWGILLAACCVAGLASSRAATAPTTAAPADAATNSVRSVFHSDSQFGKDPFFPNSKRRESLPVVAPIEVVPVPQNTSLEAIFELLSLKGVSISPNQRLAIINHYTLAEGEEREIKVAGQVIQVRCVTVNEESAVINVRGRTKELKLRDGI